MWLRHTIHGFVSGFIEDEDAIGTVEMILILIEKN